MKPFLSVEDLSTIPGVTFADINAFRGISSFSIDTRTIKKGCLFIAISGERFDGHDFLADAVKAGAAALVVEKKHLEKASRIKNIPKIIVADSTAALGHLAMMWRRKLGAKIISITGSNGKTSTKEILLTILGNTFRVNGTEANNNNHIGVPLTILQAPLDTEYLVLEHGTNHYGEIGYTAQIAAPDFALITNVGVSHLEFFGTVAGVKKEKLALFEAAAECGGKIFVNLEDKLLKAEVKNFANCITIGTKQGADIMYKHKGFSPGGYPKIHIEGLGKTIDAVLPLFGKSNALNVAAAAAVAMHTGMNKQDIIAGIKSLQPAKRRLVPVPLKKGLLIDDTYNANPQSMHAAFEVLRNIKQYKNRWVILGDMFELGKDAVKLHKNLAGYILKIPNIRVLLIGSLMHELYMELKKYYLPVWHCKTREQLAELIGESDFQNAVTLVKGSRGMKMEEFVELIRNTNTK